MSTMTCPRCQAPNELDARFCEDCGAHLEGVRPEAACPSCGASVTPGKRYCRHCGAALTATSPQRFTAPESYTPRHLAEKIVTSKGALEGERKQVTVLFADLKGSMELLADRDPEEARKILDLVLERMIEAVHRYEGTVNQVMGDGIMALFGAPIAHEDHAVRACYAALRMQESIRRSAEELHRMVGVPVRIRVGLNSGEVVVRSIGSDLHMDYTAVGQTTHLAARMEQMAQPGTILSAPATLGFAEGYVVVTPLGQQPVKGLDTPIDVYQVIGASEVRSRLHAAAARGLTLFVGRNRELSVLDDALELARAGHGQVVAMIGEPGVGKSRLYWEFLNSTRTEGWRVVESTSVSYGHATAYLPIVELLRRYFQIEAQDDAGEIREKVTGRLLSLNPALTTDLAALLWLIDVHIDDPGWERLEPAQRRQRTLEAVQRLLFCESQVQPLVVVFEDLHWIDSETQALLDRLVESLPTARLFLLVNYRPEYRHAWQEKPHFREVRLGALAPEGAEALLRTLLGDDASLDPLKRLLIERTEGNAFFLEESVRTLVETNVLTGERGAWRLERELPSLQIPPTARAILAARIDRLSPEDKHLLQAASVIGRDVPFSLLQAIADEEEDDLRRALARLQAGEFVYESALFPDLEYAFKHALIIEVAYGSLLQDRRRALHARIVEAIERLDAERLAERVERLAHHAFRGEVWSKAVPYLRQAGARSFARSANREAVTCFEQALAAIRHLPETRDTLGAAIDIRFELRNALVPLGLIEKIPEHLSEAQRLARALDDQRRLGWVAVYLSAHHWYVGRPAEARAFGETARGIARALGDLSLEIPATFYLGSACHAAGEYRLAEEFFRTIAQSLQRERLRERFGLAGFPAVLGRAFLVWSLAERGEFAQGLAHGQDAVRMAETLDHPYSLILACWLLGRLHASKGDFALATGLLERGLGVAREWAITFLSPFVAWSLGHVYAQSGRAADGILMMEQVLAATQSMGAAAYDSLITAQLGETYLGAGRIEDARRCTEHALVHARERRERGHEAWALHLAAEIARHADSPRATSAEQNYLGALALADELGMRPLVARCHLGLGRLRTRAGKRDQARVHLTTATTMFHEMGMDFWLEQAEAELRSLP